MINYIFEVSCCWLAFYLVYALWLSKETFFTTNRGYLLTTVLLGICLPFAEISLPFSEEQDLFYYFETVTVGVQAVESQIATVVAQPLQNGISLQLILPWIYAFGVLFMSTRFFIGMSQIFHHYRFSEKQKKTTIPFC